MDACHRTAEDHQRGLPQVEPGLPGLGLLVDHGEEPHPFRADDAGESRDGFCDRPGAQLGDDVQVIRGLVVGHNFLLSGRACSRAG